MTINVLITDEHDNVLQDFRVDKIRNAHLDTLTSQQLSDRIRTRIEYLFSTRPQPLKETQSK